MITSKSFKRTDNLFTFPRDEYRHGNFSSLIPKGISL